MILDSLNRRATLPSRVAPPDEHAAIRQIGHLVLICAGVLVLSAGLLLASSVQAVRTVDQAERDAERMRAANAVDIMTANGGPLTAENADLLGRLAGLRDAHISSGMTLEPSQQQIPLLGPNDVPGTMLTWTRASTAEHLFRTFAPVRLPIIAGMMLLVLGLLIRLRRLVADIERQRRLAHRLSRSDLLTGLANRLAFETAMAELATGTAPFAILVLDLNRFKEINDALGHAAGDEVLRAVGVRLMQLLGPGDLLARVGGDEFVLLSVSRVDEPSLARLASDCIAAIEVPFQVSGRTARVGISIGIAPTSAPHPAPASLVGQADAALYRAKSRRGSAFQFTGDAPDEPVQRVRRRARA